MWLVRRLTDFRVRLQALSQCFTFLVWTAIYRIRSASPLKRTVLLHINFLFHWYRDSLQGVQRPEREVVYSLPSSYEVKNEWSHNSTPSICPYGTDRDKLTFLPCTLGCLFEYSVSYQLFVPIPFHVSSSKLHCLTCNIFTHAINNTGYERRINVSYETMNSKHSKKKRAADFRYFPSIYRGGLSKSMKKIGIDGIPVNIRTGNLRNNSQKG